MINNSSMDSNELIKPKRFFKRTKEEIKLGLTAAQA